MTSSIMADVLKAFDEDLDTQLSESKDFTREAVANISREPLNLVAVLAMSLDARGSLLDVAFLTETMKQGDPETLEQLRNLVDLDLNLRRISIACLVAAILDQVREDPVLQEEFRFRLRTATSTPAPAQGDKR